MHGVYDPTCTARAQVPVAGRLADAQELGDVAGSMTIGLHPPGGHDVLRIDNLLGPPEAHSVGAGSLPLERGALFGILHLSGQTRGRKLGPPDRAGREEFRTPLDTLARYRWTPGLKVAMVILRGYLILSVALLVVKAVQLAR